MSIERVKAYFREYGMEDRIRELAMSSATVELAAAALGCEPQRIAKTLSFLVAGHSILVVAPGDAKVDNHKYKGHFASKAKMLSREEAETLVGHAVGGVCPFAVNEGVGGCVQGISVKHRQRKRHGLPGPCRKLFCKNAAVYAGRYFLSSSTLSSFSQGRSRSFRPKWP